MALQLLPATIQATLVDGQSSSAVGAVGVVGVVGAAGVVGAPGVVAVSVAAGVMAALDKATGTVLALGLVLE